jgi:hypothetical protein
MAVLIAFLFSFIFVAACAPQQAPPVVQQVMVQCWDGSIAVSAQQCPAREQPPVVQGAKQGEIQAIPPIEAKPAVPEKTIIQTLLEKTPSVYWFNDGQWDQIVYGTKRSTGEYDPYWNYIWTMYYWDVKDKIVYVQAWDISETWWVSRTGNKTKVTSTGAQKYLPSFFQLNLTWDKTRDAKLIPNEFKKYYWNTRFDWRESEMIHILDPVYMKSPTERMKEYEFDAPLKIDVRRIMLSHMGGQVMSKMSIFYKSKIPRTSTIIFHMDSKYNLPLAIDELDENGVLLKRTSYDFDVTYRKQGKTNVPITPKMVELPAGYIIISVADMEAWREAIKV